MKVPFGRCLQLAARLRISLKQVASDMSATVTNPSTIPTRRAGSTSSSPAQAPRTYVLGLGNMGQYVVSGLKNADPHARITLLAHDERYVTAWERAGKVITVRRKGKNGGGDERGDVVDGLTLEGVWEGDTAGDGGIIRQLIVTTKVQHTVKALTPLRARLNAGSQILLLQNGMGRPESLPPPVPPPPSKQGLRSGFGLG